MLNYFQTDIELYYWLDQIVDIAKKNNDKSFNTRRIQ
jgi:hypothetical protein